MRRRIHRLVAAGMLVVVPVSACSETLARVSAPDGPGESLALSSLTPRDYFRGIVFAHGPVADAVPAIRDNSRISNWVTSAEQLRAIETMQDRIMAQIERADPTFFARFAAAMRSGDPLTIDRTLRETARVTKQAVRGLPELRVLREELAARPELMQDLRERVAEEARERRLDEATYQRALEASLAKALDPDAAGPPDDPSIQSVAVLFFAITIAVVQSYVAGFNIAGAINFYLVIAAVGPGAESTSPGEAHSLTYEQMVRSIAQTF